MLIFLFQYEWLFFTASEALIWCFVFLFLVIRYKFLLDRLSQLFLILIIGLNLFQALLVGIDYFYTRKVSFFQVVIVGFIIYASTLGSNDFKRIDLYIKEKQLKNRKTAKQPQLKNKKDGLENHFKYRVYLFKLHSIAFFLIHITWYIFYGTANGFPDYRLFYFSEWIEYPHQGYFSIIALNIISYVWKIFYFFDLIAIIIISAILRVRTRAR